MPPWEAAAFWSVPADELTETSIRSRKSLLLDFLVLTDLLLAPSMAREEEVIMAMACAPSGPARIILRSSDRYPSELLSRCSVEDAAS